MKTTMGFLAMSLITVSLALGGCAAEDASADEAGEGAGDALSSRAVTGGRFETFKGVDGKDYFRLVAANGLKLLRSEAYDSKAGPDGAMDSLLKLAAQKDERRFVIADSEDGGSYINVLGAGSSTEVIATSEVYSSKSNAERAKARIIGHLKGIAKVEFKPATSGKRFQIFKVDGETQPFKFLLRADNGETILSSEFYASKQAAEDGIKSVKDYGRLASNYTPHEIRGKRGVFSLAGKTHSAVGGGGKGNNKVVGFSEVYASKSNADRGADAVRDALQADVEVEDLTK